MGLRLTLIVIAVVALVASAGATAKVHQKSCDGFAAQHHIERGRALVTDGYSERRLIDPTPMKRDEKQAMQAHKFCVAAELRDRIAQYRKRMARKYERKLFQIAPWLGPNAKRLVASMASALAAIRRCESGNNYQAVDSSGTYSGAYQFDTGTWASVGGHGWPGDASPDEQDYRAAVLRSQRGSSPWPVCGV